MKITGPEVCRSCCDEVKENTLCQPMAPEGHGSAIFPPRGRMRADVDRADLGVQGVERGLENLVFDALNVDVHEIDAIAAGEQGREAAARYIQNFSPVATPSSAFLRAGRAMSPDLYGGIRAGEHARRLAVAIRCRS